MNTISKSRIIHDQNLRLVVILSRVTLDGVLDWILDLLTTLTYHLWLHLIIAPLLISTIYKSLEDMLSVFQPAVFH
jgi:hypothetical protein